MRWQAAQCELHRVLPCAPAAYQKLVSGVIDQRRLEDRFGRQVGLDVGGIRSIRCSIGGSFGALAAAPHRTWAKLYTLPVGA